MTSHRFIRNMVSTNAVLAKALINFTEHKVSHKHMGWVTIYITGKEDFREDVREKLEDSDLNLMPGYNGGSGDTELFSDLYWIDEKIKLRQVKEAIGAKLIWKYRLKFYDSLEAFIESQNPNRNSTELNDEEKALFDKIVASAYREAS